MTMLNGKIDLEFTLLSPLSHIGESIGPDSYLATQSILSPAGRPVDVFTYSGNALRGMLRDAGAKYFQDNLSAGATVQVPLEVFYMLWSGGAIGGSQKIDIDQARRIRRAVPHLAVFGAGVGNQILPGRINVGDALPLCKETQHLIPEHLRKQDAISWRAMTAERSYTRTDDAKDENKRQYLISPDDPTLSRLKGVTQEQSLILAESEKEARRQEVRDTTKEKPQQMRYTVEVLQPGARLWAEITFFGMSELELGALTACFAEWAKRPVLGGKSNVGMGKVRLESTIIVYSQDANLAEQYLSIEQGQARYGPTAIDSKNAYDRYLAQYSGYLQENREGLVMLIG